MRSPNGLGVGRLDRPAPEQLPAEPGPARAGSSSAATPNSCGISSSARKAPNGPMKLRAAGDAGLEERRRVARVVGGEAIEQHQRRARRPASPRSSAPAVWIPSRVGAMAASDLHHDRDDHRPALGAPPEEAPELVAHPLAGQRRVEPLLGGACRPALSPRARPASSPSSARSSASRRSRASRSRGGARAARLRSTHDDGDDDAVRRQVAAVAHHHVLDLDAPPRSRSTRPAATRSPRARAPSAPTAARRRPRPRSTRSAARPACARPAARAARACGTRRGSGPGSAGASAAAAPRRSSRLPWPETWTRGRARVHHVAAAPERLPIRRETAALVARDRARRETTVSPGPDGELAMLADADRESAESGSPWLPETKHERPRAERARRARPGRAAQRRRAAQQAEVEGDLDVVDHAPADEGDRPAAARPRRSATRWMRGIEVAKQDTSTRPRVRAKTSSKAGTTASSPRGARRAARRWCCRRAARARRGRPSARERVDVGALVGRGRGVDLEVAARQHDAGRRLDGQRRGCRARCARRGSGARGRGRSRPGSPGTSVRSSARDAALLQPPAREAEGEPAAVDRAPAPPRARRTARRCGPRGRGSAGSPRTRPARSARYSKSGTIESTPGISAAGNSIPGIDEQEMLLPTRAPARSGRTRRARRAGRDARRSLTVRSIQALRPSRPLPSRPPRAERTPQPIGSPRACDPSMLRNLKYSLRLG